MRVLLLTVIVKHPVISFLTIEKPTLAKLLLFFCSGYIFAATALGGSLGGRGTNINHREREIIAGVRRKKHKSAAKNFSSNTKFAEKMFYLYFIHQTKRIKDIE